MHLNKNIFVLFFPCFLMACATSQQQVSIGVPQKSNITSNSFNEGLPNQAKPYSEMQCFGDLVSIYNEWNTEPKPLHKKFNLSFLPVTNQTAFNFSTGDDAIPTDIGLMAQNIATNLGIGYNVIFTPSISDTKIAQGVYNTYQDSLLDRINSNQGVVLGDNKTDLKDKNITIISAITEYEVNRQHSPSGNALGNGTISGKSFSAGLSSSKSSYSGRISMIFNTAYFAQTGDYNSPRLIYNPNTTTKVTINFEDKVDSNELSFSYNGNKPSLGYKIQKSSEDSRYVALGLLVERGLLQVLGKYHRVPYWRCMEQNQKPTDFVFKDKYGNKAEKKNVVLGDELLSLEEARQVPGYDKDVEDMVRRMFRYKGSQNGLGNYSYRVSSLGKGSEIIYVHMANMNSATPWNPDSTDGYTYPIVAPQGTFNKYSSRRCNNDQLVKQTKSNQAIFDLNSEQKEELFKSQTIEERSDFLKNSEQATDKYNNALNTCKQDLFNRFNVEHKQLIRQNGLNAPVIIGGKTSLTQNLMYTSFVDLLQNSYQKHDRLSTKPYLLNKFVINLNDSALLMSDKFTELWMSAPYLKDARIYPYYIRKSPTVPYIPKNGELGDNQ